MTEQDGLYAVPRRNACFGLDTNIFYPERGDGSREAKEICGSCVLRAACLEEALNNNEIYGIWGGLSPAQRRKIQRPQRNR